MQMQKHHLLPAFSAAVEDTSQDAGRAERQRRDHELKIEKSNSNVWQSRTLRKLCYIQRQPCRHNLKQEVCVSRKSALSRDDFRHGPILVGILVGSKPGGRCFRSNEQAQEQECLTHPLQKGKINPGAPGIESQAPDPHRNIARAVSSDDLRTTRESVLYNFTASVQRM